MQKKSVEKTDEKTDRSTTRVQRFLQAAKLTSYRPDMPPPSPMAVRLAADLHPPADGSGDCTSLVASQLQAASVPIA